MKTFIFRHRPLEISIHIISWFLIFCFPIVLTESGSKFDLERYLRHSIVPLCSCLTFYINYFYLIPRYLFRNEMRKFLFLNILLIISMTGIVQFGHSFLFLEPPAFPEFEPPMLPETQMHHRPPHSRWMFVGRDLVMMIFVACLSTAVRLSLRWRQTEERLIEAEQQKTDAELKNLKNQMNPHFLLNTLNNIYALIAFNSEKAQEAVQELSRLLRYILYENQTDLVSLEKELDFINNYVSLMRIRVSRSVEICLKLDPGPKLILISPLIFISLIENAFKHGISPTEESFISISIQGQQDGRVCCEIMNSNHPKSTADKSGSGIGLEQVRRRLELLYPGRYEWNQGTNTDGSIYTSLLTIQSSEL